MFKNRFGSHYITVRSGSESSKSMTSFAKTVKTLIVFCMVVVISLTFFSVYEHIKEVQEEKNRQDFLNEQNREKIKYIVPSSNDTVSDEVKAQYRPEGYSEKIGTALAMLMDYNKFNASVKYDVIIDTSALKEKFDAGYTIVNSEGYVVYWSELTAYEKYLNDIEVLKEQRKNDELGAGDISGKMELIREEYAMNMLDYTNAFNIWESEIRGNLSSRYQAVADGKYYAQLTAAEISEMAEEGYLLLSVGNEHGGITEEYDEYLGSKDAALLWALSRYDAGRIAVQYEISYVAGIQRIDANRLNAIMTEKVKKIGIATENIVENSEFTRISIEGDEPETRIGCVIMLNKDEIDKLLDNDSAALKYVFDDEEKRIEYAFAVCGDGFTYKTEFVTVDDGKHQA
ncbi:MAG: hypothetical protein IJO96_09605 [Oscillospiraceae bacterium]|nr:hypothetical protein [Oscillospiraceae bacterium]